MSKFNFSAAALECIEETGIDPLDDLDRLRSGEVTREALLAECLDGADDDRHDGWHDYVREVVARAF